MWKSLIMKICSAGRGENNRHPEVKYLSESRRAESSSANASGIERASACRRRLTLPTPVPKSPKSIRWESLLI